MFDLVADVEHYPEFVPLCRSLHVRQRTADGEGREAIAAHLTVAYKLIHETFTSRVTLDRKKLEILVEYLEGPFRKMNNRWRFQPARAKPVATSNFSLSTNFAVARSGSSWERCSRPLSAASPRPSNGAPITFTAHTRLRALLALLQKQRPGPALGRSWTLEQKKVVRHRWSRDVPFQSDAFSASISRSASASATERSRTRLRPILP